MQTEPRTDVMPVHSSEIAGSAASSMLELLNHMDSENSLRSNVVIGLGSVILTLVAPRLDQGATLQTVGMAVIAVAAVFAIINAIITIKPVAFSGKRSLNLFYPGNYTRKLDQDAYVGHLRNLFSSDHAIVEGLARELYLYGGTVTTQARRLEWSIIVLVTGIALGTFLQAFGWALGR